MPARKSKVSEPEPSEHFTSPESSNVHSAYYNPHTLKLAIYFKDGANRPSNCCYVYQGFTQEHWGQFKSADSKGKFVLAVIKKMYKGERQGGQ